MLEVGLAIQCCRQFGTFFLAGYWHLMITLKVVDYCLPQGGSHMKGVRMLVRNFELNP